MALSIKSLTDALVATYTSYEDVTEYDPVTGEPSTRRHKNAPTRESMKKLATEIISHIKNEAEVVSVATTVNTTVSAGIPIANSAGPGTTTGPGLGSGSGTQTGSGKVK